MFTPTQYLNDETVKALQMGGFPPLQIEFLGWLSGYAGALNNSTNPVRAAHTILSREKTADMFERFIAKKVDAVAPRRVTREDHSAIDLKTRKLQKYLDQLAENVPQDGVADGEDL